MLVNNVVNESGLNTEVLMESQIERFLDGFANDVIKVLSTQTVPLKK